MKKILQYPVAVLFGVFILVFFLVDVLNPDRSYSEFENTVLTTRPAFSISGFFDGSFGSNYVEYINDQIAGRDDWISLKAVADLLLGRVESHGVTFGDDSYMVEKLQIVGDEQKQVNSSTNVVAQSSVNRAVGMVRSFLEMYDKEVTLSLVPNSQAILGDKLPEGFPGVDELSYSQQIYDQLSDADDQLEVVDFSEALSEHKDEYIYYKTDHHWTTLGAYYAYVEFCNVRGFEPVPLDQFDRKDYTGYLGTFYSNTESSALANNPDTVEAYIPKANVTLNVTQSDGTVLENWPLIANGDEYGQNMKYLIYCGGDQPYEEITNNDMTDGPTCIVVKESFGNCFIPFLVNHYSKVYVIDYRHYTAGTVTQLAQQVGADDVLCLNNISMTRNEGLVNQFSNIF